MGSYVPSTPAQRQEMLEAIGLHDFRQLYRDVPEEMLLRDGLDLPEGMSELEVSRTMTAMAARNTAYSAILRGAGAYDHYIPSGTPPPLLFSGAPEPMTTTSPHW